MADRINCPNCSASILPNLPFCPQCGHRLNTPSGREQYSGDLYRILQVDPAAEPEVIDAAYKRLAAKYHPDINKSADAESRMQEINAAYTVLSDSQKRSAYDNFRETQEAVNAKPMREARTTSQTARNGPSERPEPQTTGAAAPKQSVQDRPTNATKESSQQKHQETAEASVPASTLSAAQAGGGVIKGIAITSAVILLFICVAVISSHDSSSGPMPTPFSTQVPTLADMPKFEADLTKTLDIINGKQASSLSELTTEPVVDMLQPGTREFAVTVGPDRYIALDASWCAKDESILRDNMTHYDYSVSINGYSIPKQQFHPLTFAVAKGEDANYPDGLSCSYFVVLAYDWPVGTYRVVESYTFDARVNDGYYTYEAGKYILEYTLNVLGIAATPTNQLANCVEWDKVTKANLNSEICAYGVVAEYRQILDQTSSAITNQVVYDRQNPGAFVVNVTAVTTGNLNVIQLGTCLIAYGKVEFEGHHLFINANKIERCP